MNRKLAPPTGFQYFLGPSDRRRVVVVLRAAGVARPRDLPPDWMAPWE